MPGSAVKALWAGRAVVAECWQWHSGSPRHHGVRQGLVWWFRSLSSLLRLSPAISWWCPCIAITATLKEISATLATLQLGSLLGVDVWGSCIMHSSAALPAQPGYMDTC